MHLQWHKVYKMLIIAKNKLYYTRHALATLMLKAQIVSINKLACLLGHSSTKVTLEHYSSIIEPKNINIGANFSLYGHY